jgi:hypothetical protein
MSESWKTINDLSEEQQAVADEKLGDFNPEILPGTPVTNDSILSEAVRKANEEKEAARYKVGIGSASDPTYVENLAKAEEILNGRDFELTANEVRYNKYSSAPLNVEENKLSEAQIQKAEALIGFELADAKLITTENVPNPNSPHDRIGKDALEPVSELPNKSFFSRLFGG